MSGGGFSQFVVPSDTFTLSYKGSKSITINGSGAVLILEGDDDSGPDITQYTIDGKYTISNIKSNVFTQPYLVYFTSSITIKFYNSSVEYDVSASDYFVYYLY